jgi:hypothetical protein
MEAFLGAALPERRHLAGMKQNLFPTYAQEAAKIAAFCV